MAQPDASVPIPLPAPAPAHAPAGGGADGHADIAADGHADAPANGHAPAAAASASVLRRSILLHLRRAGPSAPDAIATAIGASRSGVAQQLRALDGAGLVTRTSVRHGVGRPRHLYDVTPDAQDLFPSNYDGLATGLLAAILEIGGETLVEDVFAARRRQAQAGLRRRLDAELPVGAPLEDRVRGLARLQDELGYIAEARIDAGGIRLLEHNCAVLDVAMGIPAACRAELQLFRDVLGADVVRERHIAAGDRCCEYLVTGPAAGS
jgi:predicted ArsR family transcriptional regulator